MSDGWVDQATVETLELHAQLASTSIGVIESRHSSVRRQLMSKSVHTHSLQITDLSAQWIMQNIRRGRAAVESQSGLEAGTDPKEARSQ